VADRESIYFATRFLTLSAFLHRWSGQEVFDVSGELGLSATGYLDTWLERADTLQDDRTSVYSQLAEIQLCLCRLVVQTLQGKLKPAQRHDITDHLVALYHKQVSESINVRELHGEIEHLQFLLKMERKLGGRAVLRPHLEGIERLLVGVLG
jgi:hypothetical protein